MLWFLREEPAIRSDLMVIFCLLLVAAYSFLKLVAAPFSFAFSLFVPLKDKRGKKRTKIRGFPLQILFLCITVLPKTM